MSFDEISKDSVSAWQKALKAHVSALIRYMQCVRGEEVEEDDYLKHEIIYSRDGHPMCKDGVTRCVYFQDEIVGDSRRYYCMHASNKKYAPMVYECLKCDYGYQIQSPCWCVKLGDELIERKMREPYWQMKKR